MRPVLVGEANPYGALADPQFALWPDPPGCAGWRLCHVVLGLTRRQYLRAFDRVNLFDGAPDLEQAAGRVVDLVRRGAPIVLLGARVCRAFGVPFRPFTVQDSNLGPRAYVLPHPSGRSRIWNDPAAAPRARRLLREFLPC